MLDSEHHQRWERRYWAFSTGISLIALIGAISAAVFAGYAYFQTKRQADIAEIANRAYVSLQKIDIQRIPNINNNSGILGLYIQPWIENTGSTPALDWTPYDHLFFVQTTDLPTWQPPNIDPEKMKLIGESPLGSHSHDGMQEMTITSDRLADAVAGRGKNLICLWIFYRDVYRPEKKRHLQMCSEIRIFGNPGTQDVGWIISKYGNFDDGD